MYRILFLLLTCVASVHAAPSKTIAIDNRVLATVRGQVITVMDVVKKLDMVFYQQFAQHSDSTDARFEFYRMNWRRIYSDLIERQLVLAWAEDKHFEVSNGDLRQELEEMFGPNVIMGLYNAGLSVSEVMEMLRADILMRRVMGFYVRMPVLAKITPEIIQKEYERRKSACQAHQLWDWSSLTIRAHERDCSEQEAKQVYELLGTYRDEQQVKEHLPEGMEVVFSQTFHSKESELAPTVHASLQTVALGHYSAPVEAVGRNTSHKSWRCFRLEKKEDEGFASLEQVEDQIREELAMPQLQEKQCEFFADLQKQYQMVSGVSEEVLMAFEPFALQNVA